jgi:hypothetical protein
MAGFVLVKRVPGTLHFAARSEAHTFDHDLMNMSHIIHSLYYGSKPSARKYSLLQRLHPAGLKSDWSDKLHDQSFVSEHIQNTHEHYLQVIIIDHISPQTMH